jgi:hypothetical protein
MVDNIPDPATRMNFRYARVFIKSTLTHFRICGKRTPASTVFHVLARRTTRLHFG